MTTETPVTETPTETPSQPTSWTSSLAPEYQGIPTFSKFKDVNDLAKSYVNLEKLVGVEKIPMPKDEKDEAAWSTVYSRLGRPEAPEKYEVKMNLAEGLQVPDEVFNALKGRAHKLGLSTKQLQGMVDHWAELENNAHMQRLEEHKQHSFNAETELRKRLGSNFDVANKNVDAFIKNFYKTPEAQEKFLRAAKNDPEFFEGLFEASKAMGEDVLKGSKTAIGMTPVEAEAEYKKMLSDLKGPLYNEMHPEHDAAVKKLDALNRMRAA